MRIRDLLKSLNQQDQSTLRELVLKEPDKINTTWNGVYFGTLSLPLKLEINNLFSSKNKLTEKQQNLINLTILSNFSNSDSSDENLKFLKTHPDELAKLLTLLLPEKENILSNAVRSSNPELVEYLITEGRLNPNELLDNGAPQFLFNNSKKGAIETLTILINHGYKPAGLNEVDQQTLLNQFMDIHVKKLVKLYKHANAENLWHGVAEARKNYEDSINRVSEFIKLLKNSGIFDINIDMSNKVLRDVIAELRFTTPEAYDSIYFALSEPKKPTLQAAVATNPTPLINKETPVVLAAEAPHVVTRNPTESKTTEMPQKEDESDHKKVLQQDIRKILPIYTKPIIIESLVTIFEKFHRNDFTNILNLVNKSLLDSSQMKEISWALDVCAKDTNSTVAWLNENLKPCVEKGSLFLKTHGETSLSQLEELKQKGLKKFDEVAKNTKDKSNAFSKDIFKHLSENWQSVVELNLHNPVNYRYGNDGPAKVINEELDKILKLVQDVMSIRNEYAHIFGIQYKEISHEKKEIFNNIEKKLANLISEYPNKSYAEVCTSVAKNLKEQANKIEKTGSLKTKLERAADKYEHIANKEIQQHAPAMQQEPSYSPNARSFQRK